ncbi:DUF992 domain-containing protein [Chelatococcus reniformis]|uniref:DUF992 domain-containing protein n=1 Tax=Chelatococcus reniformis TaxID=1494448 RepID=A0A916UPZ5_9HYPH|nr:DUF992 domain-containing protein [Chelatococcus reniformis]GGC82684.1 hypothetical protein GCM10010994_45740 [Chelatococcus reniformis]
MISSFPLGRLIRTICLPAALLLVAASPAAARNSAKVGTLTCSVAPGVGLIVGSQKSLSCVFRSRQGRRDAYVGTITRLGFDVGITSGGTLVWAVFAPTGLLPRGALAGGYGGASAEATAGLGAGANVLVGGNSRTISLQPLSIQGQRGISLAAGVGAISLEPAFFRNR